LEQESDASALLRESEHACRSEAARDAEISCKYGTRDGDAAGGADYEVTKGVLTFPPGVDSQMVKVRVHTDDEVEDDEDFFVDLHSPEPATVVFQHATVRYLFAELLSQTRLLHHVALCALRQTSTE
jgi:hypothetical protein